MPQLEQINTFASQAFWLVIAFAFLFVVVRAVAIPRITSVLEARRTKIDGDLEKAEEVRKEAEGVLADYEAAMANGRAEAQAVIRQMAEEMSAQAAAEQAALGKRLAGEIAEAEKRIAASRDEAIANIQAVSADVVQEAVDRLIGVKVDGGAAADAVKSAAEAQ